MKRFKLALAVFALVAFSAPAHAEVAVVKAIDYCTGCAVGNLGLNLEGGASSVTLHALGMQFDANDGVWRGAGAFEVRSSDSGARVRFDPAATFILGTVALVTALSALAAGIWSRGRAHRREGRLPSPAEAA